MNQKALRLYLSLSLNIRITGVGYYAKLSWPLLGNLNLGPHAGRAGNLPTYPSSQLLESKRFQATED